MTKIDRYGMPQIWDQEAEDRILRNYAKKLDSADKRWMKLCKDPAVSRCFSKSDKRVKECVRLGVPPSLRIVVWPKIADVLEQVARPELYEILQQREADLPPDMVMTIDRDIVRTYPGATSFKPATLRRILIAFANWRKDIGYCQAMSYIAAVLLSVVGELQAFFMLDYVVSMFPDDYFSGEMTDYRVDLRVIEVLFNERVPKLCAFAKSIEFEFMMSISGWLLSMFTMDLPIPTVLRIFDAVLFEGPKVLFRVAVALMRMFEPDLLKVSDVPAFKRVLKHSMRNMIDADGLMSAAFGLRGFSRVHIQTARVDCGTGDDGREVAQGSVLHRLWGRLGV